MKSQQRGENIPASITKGLKTFSMPFQTEFKIRHQIILLCRDVREMSQFSSKEGRKSSRAKHELIFTTQSQWQNFGAANYTKNIVKGRICPLNAKANSEEW